MEISCVARNVETGTQALFQRREVPFYKKGRFPSMLHLQS